MNDALPRQPAASLRVAIAQFAPVLRNVEANARRIVTTVRHIEADVVVTPELSLTGYDVGDSVHWLGQPSAPGLTLECLEGLPADRETVIGLVESGDRGPFNSAVLLRGGTVAFRHRKVYLPTYGMFDEARWFGRGSSLEVCELASGWRAGLLVCEDFWHPGLVYVLVSRGIEVLLVQAAAPGRGVWEGGAAGRFRSSDVWERIARTTAELYGIYVVLANRTGVEGGVTFAGGSLIVGPAGEVLQRGPDDGDAVLVADLTRHRLQQARVPYSHARDDVSRFIAAELMRGERP